MARPIRLSLKARKTIESAVDKIFDRLKAQYLGQGLKALGGKQLVFSLNPLFSLTSLFSSASSQEGVEPREEVQSTLLNIAGSYIDATREKAKAKVLQGVQEFLVDAQSKGVKTNVETVLGGKLADVFAETKKSVTKILETEATTVRNTAIYDAIGRIGATLNNDDPSVYFVIVRDEHCCSVCTRLHLLPDGVTPRVYKISELGSGDYKKGSDQAVIGGPHPNCRCVLTNILAGYGFNSSGMVTYKTQGHDEYDVQHAG